MNIRPLIVALAVLVPSISARADVPPEPGYVESCTVQNQTRPGRECRECHTYYGNPADYCAGQVGEGFTQACRARGASTWNEVWCKDGGATTPTTGTTTTATTGTATDSPAMTETTGSSPAPTSDEEDDCSTAPVRALALPALALAAFALAARRRVAANRR